MSFKPDQIFNQASRLASCASSAFQNISKEAESFAQVKLQKTLNSMGVVRSEDVEAIKSMISNIRENLTSVCERLETIEKQLADFKSPAKKKAKE
ncbi:accessory factor UbiK family protein [Candidatus Liberibacter solanacearum]|uniref:Accessory factor UbiK family protein n=1 Tax=Candidatus Liberibacter solanacearum TaxID=556287 RepID=A0A3R7RJI7_9HYPH|nr:accessory factor UbiK family protein [Candidatus Liberibacter solanacearum]RPD37531.1 accessory factor UbiK family protein [Candidatus Liberibacter solanacearum]